MTDPRRSRCVAALITTVSGSAMAWRRAATFGVSPSASVFAPARSADLPDHDRPRVDADTDGER